MVSKSNDQIIICEKEYKVIEICSSSALRKVYKVRDEQNVTYFIKEVKKDSPSGANEFENNAAVILDEEAENNSNYFFQTEKLAETDTASYFRIITEAGDPLDRLREKWLKALSGETYLSAVTKLMIEVAEALEYMHNEKGLLHIDLKPQNIYALGKGVDRKIKLLDLGSALPIDKLKEGDDGSAYIESTSEYQSPLLIGIMSLCCFGTPSNSIQLRRLIRELSVRDDIYALSKVMAYMLVGEPHAKEIVISGCNRYCLKKLNDILSNASQGHIFTVCEESYENGVYDNVSLMRNDLEELRDALLGVGINNTIMLKNGRNHMDILFEKQHILVGGKVNIDSELIPAIRRKENDGISSTAKQLYSLTELLDGEKKNIFICSGGGAGKSYLLYNAFLHYSDIGDTNVIPIYISLNEVTSTENSLLHLIVNYYSDYDGNYKAEELTPFFEKHPKQRYLVFADGLNEIPTTKPQNKRNAVNNLIDNLSGLPNVSVVVTSRREDIDFSRFEQYELALLDEAVLRAKLPCYNELSNELKSLLTTPFNLSLYLRLPEEYRNTVIETATDLLEANVNWLRKKLGQQGVLDGTIQFLFDLLLPVLAYQLNKNNSMIFSKGEFVSTAKRWAMIIGDDESEKYDAEIDAYLDICSAIKSTDCLTMKLTVKNLINYLVDNAVIYRSIDGYYEFIHQNIRDHLAAKGWIFLVSHFFYLKALNLDNLETFLTIRFNLHDYLNDLIRIESFKNQLKAIIETHIPQESDFYEVLFDHTTRGIKHDETAQIFNRVIINTMKALGTFTRVREEREEDYLHGNRDAFSAFFFHDFRNLDLSKVSFVDSCLMDCNFDGAVLSEKVFRQSTIASMPDLLWNNDEIVIMAYKEGYIRCVSLYSYSLLFELCVTRFDACCVADKKVFLCRNYNGKSDRGYMIAMLDVYDCTKGVLLSKSILTISLKLEFSDEPFYHLSEAEMLQDAMMRNTFVTEIYAAQDFVYLLFEHGVYRFLKTNKGYRYDGVSYFSDSSIETRYTFQKQFFFENTLYGVNDSLCSYSKKSIIVSSDSSGRYFAVYAKKKTSRQNNFWSNCFWLIDKAEGIKNGELRCLGPYFFRGVSSFGELIDMKTCGNLVFMLFLNKRKMQVRCFDEYMREIAVDDDMVPDFLDIAGYQNSYIFRVYRLNPSNKFQSGIHYGIYDKVESKGSIALISLSQLSTCIISDGLFEVHRYRLANDGCTRFHSNKRISFVSSRSFVGYQLNNDMVSLTTEYNEEYSHMHDWKRAYDICSHRVVDRDRFEDYYHPDEDIYKGLSRPHGDLFSDYVIEKKTFINDKHYIQYSFNSKNINDMICLYGCYSEESEEQLYYVANRYILVLRERSKSIFVLDTYNDSLKIFGYGYSGIDGNISQLIRLETLDDPPISKIDRLVTVVNNVIYEFELDFNTMSVNVLHRTEFFPDVWIENCSFNGVDIIPDINLHDELTRRGTTIEDVKEIILESWEENNITK